MKYAVNVTTQEEQNYVSMKLNNEIYDNRWNYITNDNDIFNEYKNVIANGYKIISFEEFKSRYEPKLKIGDTFEYNGFVCEVKEKIKEPILVGDWIRNDRNMFFKYEKWMLNSPLWVKITDQEFIKQLEIHSK